MNKSKATEALQVAQEVAAIRAALSKRGYRIRKRPKQASWSISTPHSFPHSPLSTLGKRGTGREKDNCYLLTYQPSPLSSWVLHPQTSDRTRQTLITIIQRALTKQPAGITRRIA